MKTNPAPSRSRRRRLRKKLHIGEFQSLGFGVKFTPSPELSEEQADALLDAFIIEAIEGNNLVCGGGGSPLGYGFYVTSNRRYGSCTHATRLAVSEWLDQRKDVSRFDVEDLTDAWYE